MTGRDSPPPSWYEPPDDEIDGSECSYGAHAFSACPPCCRGVEMEQAEEAADADPTGPPRCVDCEHPLKDDDAGGLCTLCALRASLEADAQAAEELGRREMRERAAGECERLALAEQHPLIRAAFRAAAVHIRALAIDLSF